jgi:hypothetical protein
LKALYASGGEQTAHFLQRLAFDLPDALGRNAELGGQFVQGRGFAIMQPAERNVCTKSDKTYMT